MLHGRFLRPLLYSRHQIVEEPVASKASARCRVAGVLLLLPLLLEALNSAARCRVAGVLLLLLLLLLLLEALNSDDDIVEEDDE